MNAQAVEVISPQNPEEQSLTFFTETGRGLAELRAQLEGVEFDCTTTKGNQEARQARKVLVGLRSAVEARRKELKAPLLKQGREIDAEAERVIGAIAAIEKPIDEVIRADERRREEERAERQRIEEARIAAIVERIEAVRRIPLSFVNATAAEVDDEIHRLTEVDVTEGMGDEHAEKAKSAQVEALRTLGEMLASKQAAEAMAAEVAAAKERQAERERQMEAEREAENARLAEERRKFEAECQAIAEKQAAERAAEAAKAAAERDELDRLRRDEEERQRVERERIEAARAEEERILAEERRARELDEEQRRLRLAQVQAAGPELAAALQALLRHYVSLVNSGDAGNWNPEEEEPVINARAALSKAGVV